MYGQSNHGVGQGPQAPRPTTFQQPNQPGPPLYRPQAPLYHPGPPLYHPGQAPLQTPSSSHFRPQNVNHNHPPFHGRPHPPPPLPPPPPVPHGNAFYHLPPYPGGRPATMAGDNASAFDSSRNSEVGRGPANPASSKPIEAKVAGQGVEELCASNGDSDMEMEDDITVPDRDQDVNHSTEVLVNAKEIGVKDTINAPQVFPGHSQVHHIPTEFSNLHGKSEGSTTSKPTLEVRSQAMDLVHNAECPLNSHIGKSVSLADKLTADTTNSKTHSELIRSGSPMRLIQDYASDDSLENDDELLYKNMKPSRVLPSIIVAELVPNKDTSSTLETETGSKIRNNKEKGKEGSGNVSKSHLYNSEDGRSFISTGKAGGCQDNNCGNRSPVRDASGSSKRGNTLKESEDKKAKTESASLKVDEFGRVVRAASSDSDSDSRYNNRRERRTGRGRGRSRSRSRSRSPLDRRRTRRSPRRRKEKRSRSRSWSPRNRRSRSRSPTSRRSGEFGRGKFRSNKVSRDQECFDFIRGKCLRGASCRYIHRAADKSDSSRGYRSSEKHAETRSGTKGHKTKQEETKRTSAKQPERVYDDTPTSAVQERKVGEKREDVAMDSGQTIALGDGGELVNSGTVKCEVPRVVSGTTRELKIVLNKPTEPNSQVHDHKNFPERSHEPQSNNTSVAEDQMDDSSVFDDLPNQTTLSSSKNIPNHDSVPNYLVQTGSLPSVSGPAAVQFPGPSILHESPQLPPPPPLPISHGANVPHMPQFPMGYGSMPHSMSHPHQFGHRMNPHQFSVPPNSTWSLPPPPPQPPYDSRFTHGVSSQFHPSHYSARPYPTESMGLGDPRSQSGDRFSHPTALGLSTSTFLGHGNLHHQSAPFLGDPSSVVLPKSSAETHSFSRVQQASNHLQYPLGDSSLGIPGKTGGVVSQYLPDHEDNNKLSSASDFGLPRIIPHHNPYASTFEKPLGSKFGAGFGQDKVTLSENQYDVPLKLASVDGPGSGSRPATSSPCSAGALEKVLLRGDGEQYDPLFDSVETQSNAKSDKNWDPASDSDPVERHSGDYNKPLDMGGTSRHEVTAVASTTYLDNDDEFGETAEAEIGAVENESPSDIAGAEIEMETESKSPGKKKKKNKKDSRSVKPFKMAIADFVKDVLKPSWRQGNMSKEAFKTIVKKTVDKVSGAMKGHTVPKSQSKIDQYLFSSQRKLTKLVLGYVDKYVKV